jgi:hypothetical protein
MLCRFELKIYVTTDLHLYSLLQRNWPCFVFSTHGQRGELREILNHRNKIGSATFPIKRLIESISAGSRNFKASFKDSVPRVLGLAA